MRQPVEHRVVDRDAQHLAERHRAERGVVVDVAARRAVLADHRVGDPVELQHVDADPGPLGELREHRRDESAGGSHRLDLVAAPELDHALIVAKADAVAAGVGRTGRNVRRNRPARHRFGRQPRRGGQEARGGLPVPVDVVVFLDAARPFRIASVAEEALTEREGHTTVGSSGGDGREAESSRPRYRPDRRRRPSRPGDGNGDDDRLDLDPDLDLSRDDDPRQFGRPCRLQHLHNDVRHHRGFVHPGMKHRRRHRRPRPPRA